MAEMNITIHHESGLHARPLAQFVKTAKSYDAKVSVTNVTRGKGPVDGTSAVKLMLLAVLNGHEIHLSAEGNQAEEVLAALSELVERNFDEGKE
jgi:phosphotransferase system HPr (HPr) family protein